MDNKKDIAISLIINALKHNKLLLNIEAIGLSVDLCYHLSLVDIVTVIMDVKVNDNQYEDYLKFYDKIKHVNIEYEKVKVQKLAEYIYNQLIILKQQQQK